MVPPEFVEAVISERLLDAVKLRRQNEARKAKKLARAEASVPVDHETA